MRELDRSSLSVYERTRKKFNARFNKDTIDALAFVCWGRVPYFCCAPYRKLGRKSGRIIQHGKCVRTDNAAMLFKRDSGNALKQLKQKGTAQTNDKFVCLLVRFFLFGSSFSLDHRAVQRRCQMVFNR